MNVRLRVSLSFLLLGGPLFTAIAPAQTVPPVSENIVVSASLAPETEPAVSAPVTVITRQQIEKSGKTTVLELLREVPGVDIVQIGGPGKVASVFLRGANSTQTLLLIDGVRVNRPDFAGYDLSALSTEDVERIEIARGPFSALYGSDAIGGVISIFTRPGSKTPAGSATAALGNKAFHEETLFASGGTGDFTVSLSGRDVFDAGDTIDVGGTSVNHDSWRDRNGSAHLEWTPSDGFGAGLEVSRMFARSDIPSDGANPTPQRETDLAQTTWIAPIHWKISEENSVQASLSSVEANPTFSDPRGAFGYTNSSTVAITRGARVLDTWDLPGNTLSAQASYEASKVHLTDSFGTELNDARIHTWGMALEDQVALVPEKLLAVAGIRYDHHSAFGSATSPRISLVYQVTSDDSLRASFGTAFRAPAIGELYYPFSGNADLQPEKSRSYDVGYTRRAGKTELDLSLFRNDIRDLIEYDFVTNVNANIGKARTEGIEASLQTPIVRDLLVRVAYTWLKATDQTTGLPLLRRPRNRGSLDLAWNHGRWSATATAIFTGRRADVDSATFARAQDPSNTRVDFTARYHQGAVAPFVRILNLTDRRYAEANGFPAPRRRIAAGLTVSF